jgi:hypothetical protein
MSAKRQEVKEGPGTHNGQNAPLNVPPRLSRASESMGSRKFLSSQLSSGRHRIVDRKYRQLNIGPNIIGKVLI